MSKEFGLQYAPKDEDTGDVVHWAQTLSEKKGSKTKGKVVCRQYENFVAKDSVDKADVDYESKKREGLANHQKKQIYKKHKH